MAGGGKKRQHSARHMPEGRGRADVSCLFRAVTATMRNICKGHVEL